MSNYTWPCLAFSQKSDGGTGLHRPMLLNTEAGATASIRRTQPRGRSGRNEPGQGPRSSEPRRLTPWRLAAAGDRQTRVSLQCQAAESQHLLGRSAQKWGRERRRGAQKPWVTRRPHNLSPTDLGSGSDPPLSSNSDSVSKSLCFLIWETQG